MRSRDTRLAVMFATAPDSNVSRAFAMSTNGVSTGTPTADTDVTRAADERAHEIDVVDHQIEHDGDVRAARIERREPVALDEPRRVDVRQRRAHGAIEPLDVAGLHHARRCARAIASSASASSSVVAIGFSISTCMPALERRRAPPRKCAGVGTTTSPRRTSSSSASSVVERLHAELRCAPSRRARHSPRRSRRSSAPGDVAQNARVMIARAPPAPITPMRTRASDRPTPRSLRSKNARNSCISGIRLQLRRRALPRLRDDSAPSLKNSRYARFSSRTHFLGKSVALRARRCSSPYSLIGLPTAFTYGGTSFATREQPPMKLNRPIVANWCTAHEPGR